MRVVWVPQWAVLPVIVEDRAMVEENAQREHEPSTQLVDPLQRTRPSGNESRPANHPVGVEPVSYDPNFQPAPSQQQVVSAQPLNHPGQQPNQQMGRRQSPGTFGMSSLAGALPEYHGMAQNQAANYEHQHGYGGSPNPMQNYQHQPFASQLNTGAYPLHAPHYPTPFQDQLGSPSTYSSLQSPRPPHSGGPSPIHSGFPPSYYAGQQQHQQYLPYAGHYGHAGQMAYPAHFPPVTTPGFSPHVAEASITSGRPPQSGYASAGMLNQPAPSQYLRPGDAPVSGGSSNSSGGGIPSTPRGPPRKPKQSGHALWVGNLPAGTVVSDLKDHFSRDATKDIESVFLISKSNCAFVNYRTETACAAAMTRFHDSRFHGVRLVCRLRRSTAASPAPGVPTGPAALMFPSSQNQTAVEAIAQNREVSSKAAERAATESSKIGEQPAKTPDKYFVMKSLTIEDMELSVRNNIWATQAHNEDALNKAYETTENVYLIFSANKSGEYFGFARMASPINEESAADLDWAPRGQIVTDDPDLPRSIPTPATEFAPRGRIIDDSARGTIFWEADLDDDESADQEKEEAEASPDPETDKEDGTTSGDVQAFGKPFRIEWVTTNRLPFYRTRGLRNPWNANREVKIARDGTELETSVGRRLAQMFQRPPTDQPIAVYGPQRPY